MHVIRDDQEGTFTFVPQTPDERGSRISIFTLVRPGNKLLFYGIMPNGELRFRAGDVLIILHGKTRSDWDNIERIRRICRVSEGATGGLVFVDQGEIEGEATIIVTGAYCTGENCGKKLIDVESCKVRTCARCRARVPAPTH